MFKHQPVLPAADVDPSRAIDCRIWGRVVHSHPAVNAAYGPGLQPAPLGNVGEFVTLVLADRLAGCSWFR